ncbi:MAG: DNA adenine methylase [Endomicrobium sp.]|jgi:adenine-specific DNA-methyltransferase|nr:DNA adenine methylase [Endomicrobium sp.]
MSFKKHSSILNKNKTSLLQFQEELSSILQKYKITNKNIKYSHNSNGDIQCFCCEIQGTLFDLYSQKHNSDLSYEKIYEDYKYSPRTRENYFQIYSRRYIGSKHKLLSWIFSIITKECSGNSFADIFAGTGIVAAEASKTYKKIIANDFLYSNYAIYKAFFENTEYNYVKIKSIIDSYNSINSQYLADNYFSHNFGNKFFSNNDAKKIGFIRDNIETNKLNLTDKEYHILVGSLIYSIDKIANTVGHFDAYIKKASIKDSFLLKQIDPFPIDDISIYRQDANLLARSISADVVYIDPPYNSRQYSRFYHILENLTKWDKPKLYGVALKPESENMSDYCRTNAKSKFAELIRDLQAKYIVVSYNNTYKSKSNSSKNKISLDDIKNILKNKGSTKIFEKGYRYFTTGNTDFQNHKEYLFVTKVQNDKRS